VGIKKQEGTHSIFLSEVLTNSGTTKQSQLRSLKYKNKKQIGKTP
jgi:hypothetical protein